MKENAIIKRCQAGDKSAFDELIRLFYPYVSKYLLKLTANETLAEDITQETFLKIIRTIDTFQTGGKASFATYIITVAKNCFIDYTRKNKVYFEDISEIEVASSEDIEEMVLTKIDYEKIIGFIDGLPLNQRQAIRLKYIDELTLNEIAEITGVETKTVKSRIHEGSKKLRALFARRKD